jgi:hypothetical protein
MDRDVLAARGDLEADLVGVLGGDARRAKASHLLHVEVREDRRLGHSPRL